MMMQFSLTLSKDIQIVLQIISSINPAFEDYWAKSDSAVLHLSVSHLILHTLLVTSHSSVVNTMA